MINYEQAKFISESHLLETIIGLYLLNEYNINFLPPKEGSTNLIYICDKHDALSKIIRISFRDSSEEHYLAELEYVNYLANNGANVSRAISSRNKRLVESITVDNTTFYVTVFYKAKGKSLTEIKKQHLESFAKTEFYINCGKALGKLHQLAKLYHPTYERHSFFDKYSEQYINQLIPDQFSLLKQNMIKILAKLQHLTQNKLSYGIVHFDFYDSNYNIDVSNGQITAFNFDSCCRFWYVYDLAGLWLQGMEWIQFEAVIETRKSFMNQYFTSVMEGYRLETSIHEEILSQLSLFIQINIIVAIIDEFEHMKLTHDFKCNEILSYRMKCIEEDIEYLGFFDSTFNSSSPFQYESRALLPI